MAPLGIHQHREEAARTNRDLSFFKTLSDSGVSGDNIVTFNYTDFFDDRTRPKMVIFMGNARLSFVSVRAST